MELSLKVSLAILVFFCIASSDNCGSPPSESEAHANSSAPHLHAAPVPTTPTPTYYILAIQWPSGVCSQPSIPPCKQQKPNVFTIHGLWPTPSSNKEGVYIPSAFSPGLRTTLEQKWLNLLRTRDPAQSNEEFWKAQWLKHGKDQLMSQEDFFRKGVELYDEVSANLVTSLREKGVKASYIKVSVTKIAAALRTVYGAQVQLVCGEHFHLGQQLLEIRIRYSASFDLEDNLGGEVTCTGQNILFNP